MQKIDFPKLETSAFASTRDALHGYSQIPGAWLRAIQSHRKHWWHICLRPTLHGVTTGVIYTENVDFEIELNLRYSMLTAATSSGDFMEVLLEGQPAAVVAIEVNEFLLDAGVSPAATPGSDIDEREHPDYSDMHAAMMQGALSSACAALTELRAGVAEETSPLGFWPHHFDLAMLWLPGDKIAGQDATDEEHSDVQMNFGFTFGDSLLPEPYYYVTAYPTPEGFPTRPLHESAEWFNSGFAGMVWRYSKLTENSDPASCLLTQLQNLLDEGRQKIRA